MKEYPGIAVETVSDSSRYFVLRIQDDSGEAVNVSVLCVSFLSPNVTCASVYYGHTIHALIDGHAIDA